MYQPKASTIYLNRDCSRNCPYCNNKDPIREKGRLSVEQWKRIFLFLRDEVGIEFFLILGTEPLLMAKDLVELVKFWDKEDMEYGLYSTSPPKLFDEHIRKLLDAGLNNWSSGIDFIPEVYDCWEPALSNPVKALVEKNRKGLQQKARDSLRAFKFLEGKVRELHALITISKMNIEMVPTMIEWLTDNFNDSIHIGINFVEYSDGKDMDFATTKDDDYCFSSTPSDLARLVNLSHSLQLMSEKAKNRLQIPIEYVGDIQSILHLDWKCSLYAMALSVDCNGEMRLCGYRRLPPEGRPTVFDLMDDKVDVLRYLDLVHFDCKGCYWSYPYVLMKQGSQIVNYRSRHWKDRDKELKK